MHQPAVRRHAVPQVGRRAEGLADGFRTARDESLASDVQIRHEQCARTCALHRPECTVEKGLKAVCQRAFTEVQHRRLCQAPGHLVGAGHNDIGTQVAGQVWVEAEMRAPRRLVNDLSCESPRDDEAHDVGGALLDFLEFGVAHPLFDGILA